MIRRYCDNSEAHPTGPLPLAVAHVTEATRSHAAGWDICETCAIKILSLFIHSGACDSHGPALGGPSIAFIVL